MPLPVPWRGPRIQLCRLGQAKPWTVPPATVHAHHLDLPQVDPQKLLLSPDSFVTPDGTSLQQLRFDEVVAQAQGIAFCSAQQALPFLHPHRSLSVDPLALLVTSELSPEFCVDAQVSCLRFSTIFEPTSEAILLRGSLVQLGDEPVAMRSTDIAEVDTLATAVFKLALYRDETQLDWSQVMQAPVRASLQGVPGLVLCSRQGCGQDCPNTWCRVGGRQLC